MSTNIDKFCQLAQAAVGKAPYPEKGSGTESYAAILKGSAVDCSGFIVALMKEIGIKSYHGSNTLWRSYMMEKGSISDHKSSNGYSRTDNPLKSTQLKKGMLVYKWNSNTPAKFNDGLGDYQHVGIVTSVSPLHIVHSTSVNYAGVTMDTKISTWCAWGKHKGMNFEDSTNNDNNEEQNAGGDTMSYNAVVKTSGGKLNVRESAGGTVIGKFANGTKVQISEQSGDWALCSNGKIKGWCSVTYLKKISDSTQEDTEDTEDDEDTGTEMTLAQLTAAYRDLDQRVSILEESIKG